MTFSKLGADGQLVEQLDQQTGKKKFVFTPTLDATGKELIVQLPQVSRKQGTYIIGATGTGKSGLITNLVLQDIKQGKGVAVLDPHTDLTNSILARLPSDREKDVILLDALDATHVFGINLYQCDDPTNDELVQETYERVEHIFDVLWLEEQEDKFGPRVKQGIRNSTLTLIGNSSIYGCGMLEIPMLFEEDQPRANMLAQLPQPIKQIVEKYWKRHEGFDKGEKADRADMVANKVEDYITNLILRRIVGQSRTTINFRDIMENGKILLVKLPGKFEKMTEILGAMIIAQILATSYAREKQQKRRQFNIYADEFQRFATRDFAKLLTEASRKYNTPVTIAHQARDFIDLKNKAASIQVGNLIVLRIIHKDAEELVGNFYLEPEEGEPLEKAIRTPVLEPIQYMVSHGIHPLEHTRTFIETYGKDLVERAKKEEDDERARLAEERRYEHDLAAGVRYYAPPLIQVTYHYRRLLQLLNKLFYDAMKAGKEGKNLDDIPLPYNLVNTFIQALGYGNPRLYLDSLHQYVSQYSSLMTTQGFDFSTRAWELRNKLTEFPALVQHTEATVQRELHRLEAQLPAVYRTYLIAEAALLREICVIVKQGWWYRNALPELYQKNTADYAIHYNDIDKPFQFDTDYMRHLRRYYHVEHETSHAFSAWEDAVEYYWRLLNSVPLWFDAENTLRDRRSWQKQRTLVWCECTYHKKEKFWGQTQWWVDYSRGNNGKKSRVEALDTWVLLPGIERTWYTDAMLQAEVSRRIEAHQNIHYHGHQLEEFFGEYFPHNDDYTALRKPIDNLNQLLFDIYALCELFRRRDQLTGGPVCPRAGSPSYRHYARSPWQLFSSSGPRYFWRSAWTSAIALAAGH